MLDFMSNRRKAGILAAAMGFLVVASACAADSDRAAPATVPAAAQQTDSQTAGGIFQTGDDRYWIDFDPDDYADDTSINEAVAYLYQTQGSEGEYIWLDTDLFRKEIAYANAIVEAYENGECPDEIKEEAKFLAAIHYPFQFHNDGYYWEYAVACLNSVYHLYGLGMEHSEAYSYVYSIGDGWLRLDDDDPVYYNTAKLIHEACCDGDHSEINEDGYPCCSDIQEDADHPLLRLRLSQ